MLLGLTSQVFSRRPTLTRTRCGLLQQDAYCSASRSNWRAIKDSGSSLPVQVDLLERYRALVTLGSIKYDESQVRIVMKLKRLQKELIDYAPPVLPARFLGDQLSSHGPEDSGHPWWMFSDREKELSERDGMALVTVKSHAEELAALDTPKGLLLTGPPGSGKSFLIDMWYSSVPTRYKTRKHYNQLVLEIYRGVWEETQRRMAAVHASSSPPEEERAPWSKVVREQWRRLLKTGTVPIKWSRSSFPGSQDPTIAFTVARRLVLSHWLLVFDEIQLLDVSSASLLADVLSWYWRMGGVIVGTSNKIPDDLYKNGVQRDRLEPFVEALKARCPVETLDCEKDWRHAMSGDGVGRTWYTYERRTEFEKTLNMLSASGAEPRSQQLTVFGRSFYVPWISGDACKFTFSELCEESLGPAYYITLASTFPIILITDIPVLLVSAKNQARRFISLIDALYEARCRIFCLAEAEPEDLFFSDALSKPSKEQLDLMMAEVVTETQNVYRPNVSSYDSPNMAEAPAAPAGSLSLDKLSIFSGEDEQFAFKRALSRLLEMTSISYNLLDSWAPLPLDARKWQQPSTSPQSRTTASEPISTQPAPAAHQEPSHRHLHEKRPLAPHLNPEHMWGIRDDWGRKAKKWGQGAQAYSEKNNPPSLGGD